MDVQTDTPIIGAGVIGVCSAHYLAEAGHAPLIIDRRGVVQFREVGFDGPAMEHTMAARIELLLDDALKSPH